MADEVDLVQECAVSESSKLTAEDLIARITSCPGFRRLPDGVVLVVSDSLVVQAFLARVAEFPRFQASGEISILNAGKEDARSTLRRCLGGGPAVVEEALRALDAPEARIVVLQDGPILGTCLLTVAHQ